MDDATTDYAVRLVLATRDPARYGIPEIAGQLEYGASPRASLGIVRAARALALLRGRDRATPQDVYDVAYDVLNLRLVLSYRALAEGSTVDDVLVQLLRTVRAPGSPAAWHGVAPAPTVQTVPGAAGATGGPPAGPVADAVRTAPRRPAAGAARRTVTGNAGATVPDLLRRAELAVTRRVHGLREGDHLALLGGNGVEAGEARPYAPGDDVRRIDWTVTARTGTPYVRDAIAERELDVMALVDLSGSLDFGTAGGRKIELALAVLAGLGSLATRGHDRFGVVLLTGSGPIQIPARSGRMHLAALLARAEAIVPSGSADLAAGIDHLDRFARRRGLAVVISDFIGPATWEHALGRLARRHDTLAIELADPRELRLPDVGFLTVVDAETGRRREIDTSRPDVRAAYAAHARDRGAAIASAATRAGASHLRLTTDRDWVGPLVAFLDRRQRARMVGRRAGAPMGAIR